LKITSFQDFGERVQPKMKGYGFSTDSKDNRTAIQFQPYSLDGYIQF